MKTHAEVEFPIFPRRYCVYHLAISHYGDSPELTRLQLFTQLKQAQLFARQQFKLTMGSFPKVKVIGMDGKVNWQEEGVLMNSDLKSEIKLQDDIYHYLVIISRNHFESHCLSLSSLW